MAFAIVTLVLLIAGFFFSIDMYSRGASESKEVRDFKERHITEVKVDGMSELGLRVIQGFVKFVAMPEDWKRLWTFYHNGPEDPEEPDEGWLDRRKEAGKDPKEFFHYRPALRRKVEDRVEQGILLLDAYWLSWLDDLEALWQLNYSNTLSFAKVLDCSLGFIWYLLGTVLRLHRYSVYRSMAMQGARRNSVIRVLYYHPVSGELERVTPVVADLHDDRDGITTAIMELSPGFIGMVPQGTWQFAPELSAQEFLPELKPFHFGHCYMFPGVKLLELLGDFAPEGFNALAHAVIERRSMIRENQLNRGSVVFFAHPDVPPERFSIFVRSSKDKIKTLKPKFLEALPEVLKRVG